jgi:serine/threonine-protein kinase
MALLDLKEIKDKKTFVLDRLIAQGGMGAVYEARQLGAEGFEKTVAIKTILADFTSDPEFVDLFVGEAKLVADLVHQNIVQMYSLGQRNKDYYIAMEYIDGINLEEFIDRHVELGKAIPIDIATFIVSRVCRGLEYAHNKTGRDGRPLGVVHRDISPKNEMITFLGVVKLTDFGIAKAAGMMADREGEVLMGKVQYMSPEQAQFRPTDRRSDIFSLGIVMYELLAGFNIFSHDDTMVIIQNVVAKRIAPIREYRSDVPPEVDRILLKALERDLDSRYQDSSKMGQDLEYYMFNNRKGPSNETLQSYLREIFPERTKGPGEETGEPLAIEVDDLI